MTRLSVFSGSSRADSYNQKLANQLASDAGSHGAELTVVNLGEFELPIYNGDLESTDGLPVAAAELKKILQDQSGMIIACPEYNGFMTPMLINTIAWCTRSAEASVDLSAFAGKTVLIAGASPGPGGGGRAVSHLRTLLSGIGAIVFPQSLTIPSAYSAFDEQGLLKDEKMTDRAKRMVGQFVEFTRRFE